MDFPGGANSYAWAVLSGDRFGFNGFPRRGQTGVPLDYTVQINSVEADWDDESERVEVRVELFLSSNRADVNINQLRYWVTILAQI